MKKPQHTYEELLQGNRDWVAKQLAIDPDFFTRFNKLRN